jgi:glutamate racemase
MPTTGAIDAIGVFDSGVGGLTVVAALRRRLPGESILYLGDTARLPYGSKSPATVTRYTQRNVAFLVERGVKAVVVACNTASALALPDLSLPVPTWGVVEPGAERAAALSTGRVGVIATEATVRSDAYPRALRQLRPGLEIASQACPLFVPLVEEGWHDDPIAEQVAARYLGPLLARQIDTLVLGCTHYPLLAPVLARVAGPQVRLVDSAAAVADAVAAGLAERGLLAGGDGDGPAAGDAQPGAVAGLQLCVTDAGPSFQALARRILVRPELCLEWVEVA